MADDDLGQPVGAPVPGWTRRPWPAAIRLEGRYVRLEPLTRDHALPLFDAVCGAEDDDLWTYRPTDRPASISAMTEHLVDQVAATDMETLVLLPTEGRGAGTPQGIFSFMRIEPAHGQVELAGVLYSRALQRTRAATEAVHLAMRYAFDDLGYRRFEWKCDALNEPSRRAAARLGLSYEGRFRHHLVVKGRNRDTDWFSVTDAEWPVVRAAHDAWLAPTNFDGDGVQRSRLSALSAQRAKVE